MVNKVILLGNVGKDPDVRHLDGNKTVASISLATTETHKDKSGNKVEQTEWHNLIFWNSLAEIVEKYVKKGAKLYIEGKLRTRSWEDQNGVKRYTTEIYADTMQMIPSGKREERPPLPEAFPDGVNNNDDSPF